MYTRYEHKQLHIFAYIIVPERFGIFKSNPKIKFRAFQELSEYENRSFYEKNNLVKSFLLNQEHE